MSAHKPFILLGLRKIFTCQRAFCRGLCPNPYIITALARAGAFCTYPRISRVSQYREGSLKGHLVIKKCCFGVIAGGIKYHSRDSRKMALTLIVTLITDHHVGCLSCAHLALTCLYGVSFLLSRYRFLLWLHGFYDSRFLPFVFR